MNIMSRFESREKVRKGGSYPGNQESSKPPPKRNMSLTPPSSGGSLETLWEKIDDEANKV